MNTILFDIRKNGYNMTRPKDVSTKWKKSTIDIAKSSTYGVVTVYDNSYGAKQVLKECRALLKKKVPHAKGSWDVHTHCEWCGQALDYVAVIVGLNDKGAATISHIGCDCVGKIFGVSWYGYRNADEAKRLLIAAAKSRRRAEEYPIKYAKQLAWLDKVPEFLLKKHTFLVDMKRIMRTGERMVTKKMENYLNALMSRPEFDPKTFATAKLEIDKTTEKIRGILRLVESVDNTDELRSKQWSAYGFVKSILDRYEQWHSPLTQSQMNGLNKVYTRYMSITKKSASGANKMKGDPNEIPW